MYISTKSLVLVRGRSVRVLSSRFNDAVRRNIPIQNIDGKEIKLSKNRSWLDASKILREGKKLQATVE